MATLPELGLVQPASQDLRTLVEAYERDLIRSALDATGGNQRRAAAALGVLPTTLHEKIKRLGLRRTQPVEGESLEP